MGKSIQICHQKYVRIEFSMFKNSRFLHCCAIKSIIPLNRLKDDPKLVDNINTIQDKWFRRLRSKVYFYLVPIIGLFYFIPAIQFAFLGIIFTLIFFLIYTKLMKSAKIMV